MGGRNKEAQLVPPVAMRTSLVSRGKFSDAKSEGSKEGQMGSTTESYPSHAKGKALTAMGKWRIWNAARKHLRYTCLYLTT